MTKWKYSRFNIEEINRILKDFRYNQTKYPDSPYPNTVGYDEGVKYWIEKTRQSILQIDQLQTQLTAAKQEIKLLCSQKPCPKCGYGVTGACYGCEIKKLQGQLTQLRALKCPPISDGDVCICLIVELEEKLAAKDEEIEKYKAAAKELYSSYKTIKEGLGMISKRLDVAGSNPDVLLPVKALEGSRHINRVIKAIDTFLSITKEFLGAEQALKEKP